MESVGEGVPGYVTPKVAIGAVVGNDAGEILLVQRADSGVWLYPTGWADVGYSPAEVAVKEVEEETGIECEPVQLLAVIDGMRMGFTRFGMYMVLFHCRAVGGELQRPPAGDRRRRLVRRGRAAGAHRRSRAGGVPTAFAAIRGEDVPVVFDPPRRPVWRGDERLTGSALAGGAAPGAGR